MVFVKSLLYLNEGVISERSYYVSQQSFTHFRKLLSMFKTLLLTWNSGGQHYLQSAPMGYVVEIRTSMWVIAVLNPTQNDVSALVRS